MLNNDCLSDIEKSDSGFLGIFLRHKQNLKWLDSKYNRHVNYELNSKLFAINEPYLMKTERDSLLKLKINSEMTSETDETSKKLKNSLKKRKKNFDKKLSLLDGNFSSPEEKSMALSLIEKYLNNNNNNSELVITKNCNKKLLLNSLNLQELDSNPEAQTFVNSLFCNRFESLNYRTKLLCNPYYKTIKVKFGLSNFLIPPRCSFAGIDVIEGVKMLTKYLTLSSIDSSLNQKLICYKNPFVIIMDPAWDNNKSVKRKRTYETVSLDYLRRLCKETKLLIDLIISLKSRKILSKNTKMEQPSIICAIWTTNLDKDFVIEEMLPLMNMKLSYVFKWHKITKIGLPVKVHAGQEFLILAESKDNFHTKNSMPTDSNYHQGIMVSIPSAIHSHKPTIMPMISKLYNFNLNIFQKPEPINTENDQRQTSTIKDDVSRMDHQNNNDSNYWLVANEFIHSMIGIELFSRYLQPGFHSIGFECIKLQNEKMFGIVSN